MDESDSTAIDPLSQPPSLTVASAAALASERPCDTCHRIGVEIVRELNNNGLYIKCPACGKKHAWAGVQYLRHDKKPQRTKKPPRFELETVWPDAETRCLLCDRTKAELSVVGVGRHAHHSPRYTVAEHEGQALPLCSECHDLTSWRQRVVDRERRTLRGDA